jgi:putative transposase
MVRTEAVGAVAQALGLAVAGAGQGIACVYGHTGRGKTVALRAAVTGLPAGFEAAWVMAPVRPSLAELRRAVFDALGLAGRFPQRSAQADALIVEALAEPWVLVVDEAQRLPLPCLQYLQGLFDQLGTRVTLVLCGAGVERAVVRLPQLASRVSAWQEVPRLPAAQVPEVMGDFHPLWRTVSAKDLRWVDGACAQGSFRAWSVLTTHLQNALLTVPDAAADRTLLRRLFQRVGPAAVTDVGSSGWGGASHGSPIGKETVAVDEDGDPEVDGAGESALPAASLAALCGPAVRRLLELREDGALKSDHVRSVAAALEVSEWTVWRWLAAAQGNPRAAAAPGARDQRATRFTVTPEVRRLLALWKGNVAAVQRELAARAAARTETETALEEAPGPDQGVVVGVPSLTTLHRAIRRDLSAGERAGLAGGERAARRHDVFLSRPRGWRNQVWETDHVQAPVWVEVEGRPRRPWVTWFVDCATCAITGAAVTAGAPSRESVLAALRSAVLTQDPYGPFGGLPEKVRMDRGKDFRSRAVAAAFTALDVTVEELPAYTPHFVALPGYVRQPRPGRRPAAPKDEELLSFEEFTERLLEWIGWWNTEHHPSGLGGRTPLQVWQADATPLREIPARDVWTLTLEDAGLRKITTGGVRFHNRSYVAAWMTGNAGIEVHVRYMPHHDHEIELFDPSSGRHLGSAHLAAQATPDQISAVRTARQARARQLRKDLEASRDRERYAAATAPGPPRTLTALTAAEAEGELAAADRPDLAALALPDLLPLAAPPPGLPVPASVAARLATSAPQPAEPWPVETATDSTPDHGPLRRKRDRILAALRRPARCAGGLHPGAAGRPGEPVRHDRGAGDDVCPRRRGAGQDPRGQHLPPGTGTHRGRTPSDVPCPPDRPRGALRAVHGPGPAR